MQSGTLKFFYVNGFLCELKTIIAIFVEKRKANYHLGTLLSIYLSVESESDKIYSQILFDLKDLILIVY